MSLKNFLKAAGLASFDETEQKLDPSKPLKAQTTETKVKVYATEPEYSTNISGGTNVQAGELKQKFYDIIKDSNLPGPDFYEFNEMLKAMSAIPIEMTKYVAAFQGLAATGLTKVKLIESAEHYKTIIAQNLSEFETAYTDMVKVQVEDKKSLIELKTKQVQELAVKIGALNEEIKKLNEDSISAEMTLRNKKDSFISSGNLVISEIDNELTKINSFIS